MMEVEIKNGDGGTVLQSIPHGELFMSEGILYQKLHASAVIKKALPPATFLVSAVKTGETFVVCASTRVFSFKGKVIATRS